MVRSGSLTRESVSRSSTRLCSRSVLRSMTPSDQSRVAVRLLPQQLDVADDRGERVLQLVRHGREELRLAAVGLPQLGARPAARPHTAGRCGWPARGHGPSRARPGPRRRSSRGRRARACRRCSRSSSTPEPIGARSSERALASGRKMRDLRDVVVAPEAPAGSTWSWRRRPRRHPHASSGPPSVGRSRRARPGVCTGLAAARRHALTLVVVRAREGPQPQARRREAGRDRHRRDVDDLGRVEVLLRDARHRLDGLAETHPLGERMALAGGRDRDAGLVGEELEDGPLRHVGATPAEREVDREDAEQLTDGVEERCDEGVLGVPRVGVAVGRRSGPVGRHPALGRPVGQLAGRDEAQAPPALGHRELGLEDRHAGSAVPSSSTRASSSPATATTSTSPEGTTRLIAATLKPTTSAAPSTTMSKRIDEVVLRADAVHQLGEPTERQHLPHHAVAHAVPCLRHTPGSWRSPWESSRWSRYVRRAPLRGQDRQNSERARRHRERRSLRRGPTRPTPTRRAPRRWRARSTARGRSPGWPARWRALERKNRAKTRSWSAGGMPMPESETTSRTVSGRRSSGCAASATRPPSGVNFTAFESRLVTIRSSAAGSPSIHSGRGDTSTLAHEVALRRSPSSTDVHALGDDVGQVAPARVRARDARPRCAS